MSVTQTHRISLNNKSEELAKARAQIESFLRDCPFQVTDTVKIILAVDEALANIVEHAQRPDHPPHEVQIEVTLNADQTAFKIQIHDTAKAYNPTTLPEVHIDKHLRSGSKGGLGLYIMRKVMDEIDYEYTEENQNRLTMIRYSQANQN